MNPLPIFGEVRTQAKSIGNRIAKYNDNPGRFQSLSHKHNRLVGHIDEVERLHGHFPNALPEAFATLFDDTLEDVRNIFKEESMSMPESLSKAFDVGSSSSRKKVESKALQVARANAKSAEMDALENKIDNASRKLQHLVGVLATAVKSDENREIVTTMLGNVVENSQGVYRATIIAPAPSDSIRMEFDTKDEQGNPATPEGDLKQSVLSRESSAIITAAIGAMPAYGVFGMAGVGKTVALQGLAYDKNVRRRFPDGILFMTLGQDASLKTVLGGLAHILAMTGATAIVVGSVKASTSLHEAVDIAVPWFKGRICLFLVDDVWPTGKCKTGFFTGLRQILRESPESRMVISTRSVSIAQCAGNMVKFDARDTLGPVSMNIFMGHAYCGWSRDGCVEQGEIPRSSVLKILGICAGLPIALAVAGCAVAFLACGPGNFQSACESYGAMLEQRTRQLGDEDTMEGKSLNACILLSLEYLEVKLSTWKSRGAVSISHSFSELYSSLCVLEKQAWAPVSVLGRLWGLPSHVTLDIVNFLCEMSLATLRLRQLRDGAEDEAGIELHDLHLDFCKRQAMKSATTAYWHAQLLNGYQELPIESACEDPTNLLMHKILNFTPRSWWSHVVPEDGYFQANLSRHLVDAGHGIELAALLLRAEWTECRSRSGGLLALKTDFELLGRYFTETDSSGEEESLAGEGSVNCNIGAALCSWWSQCFGLGFFRFDKLEGHKLCNGEVQASFESMFKAVQLSWRRMDQGLRVFQFHLCGRLVSLRKSNALVEAYVTSVENITPKPYLRPVSSFFPKLNSSLVMEIPVDCWCVACSPCGRYFAAGGGCGIVVGQLSDGEILERMRELENDVECVTFAEGSRKIVSGSRDGKIIVWEWESSESPVQVMEGHRRAVLAVAVSSDGGQIFSGSEDNTLKIWDATSGAQVMELHQAAAVHCIAVCEVGKMIALGLGDGALKVLDRLTGEELFEDSTTHKEAVASVSYSPNGPYLATGSWDKTVRLWNARAWTRVGESCEGHDDWVRSVSFCPDGKQIVSGSDDGTVRLWDVESGKCIGISPKTESFICSVSFTADGERIVSGSLNGVVRIWGANFGTESKERRHSGRVRVSISPNGLQVASGSQDRTVRLWDTQTGDQVGGSMEGHADEVRCLSFSPDGRRVVSGSFDSTLRLWDAEMQTQIGVPFEGHTELLWSVSFSSDGRRIVSGSVDRTVRIWNAETHEQIGDVLQGHTEEVTCVSESDDGCYIVSRDIKETTIIWNWANRAIVWKSKRLENNSEIDTTDAETSSGEVTTSSEAANSGEETTSDVEASSDEETSVAIEGNSDADIASDENVFENCISDEEAEKVIRSCGQKTPHLWPECLPEYTAELYGRDNEVYSNLIGADTLMADHPFGWYMMYHKDARLFAVGLSSGAVAICKLITE